QRGRAPQAADLALQLVPALAELGETAVVDDGGARAALHRQPHLLRDERVADAEDDDVRRLRKVGEGRVADMVENRRVFGVHRIDRPGEADSAERFDDGTPGT